MDRALVLIGGADYNRGSEILLTGILQIISETGKYQTDISAFGIRAQWREENREYFHEFIPRDSKVSTLSTVIPRYDLFVVIGADNFDYKMTKPNEINEWMTIASQYKYIRTLLIDCSIADENISSFFIENLKNVENVTVRECLSYLNLKKYRSDILFHADPAFIVQPKKYEADFIMDKKWIGINLSPLVCERNNNLAQYIENVMEYILNMREENIILIPHVMLGQDMGILKKIYEKYRKESKVKLLDGELYSARELKFIISKCRFFIGARTHAVIAAYSMAVPTLAIGYSIKSKGIAIDLLGEKNYCIQADEIKKSEHLLKLFQELISNEEYIKKQLKENLPKYISTINTLREIL